MKRILTAALALALLAGLALSAQTLSGDEILQRAAQEGSITALGSRITTISFEVTNSDGTTLERQFAFFSKRAEGQPDKLLIYFLAPELERGTIFLSIDPVDPAEKSKIWLFLSALGQVKELVSEQDRNAGFAGSDLQNDQIGGGLSFDEDYVGKLLGEETISVNWLGQQQERSVYKVALSKKPESDVDFPSGTLWVDHETFVLLRGELVNSAQRLEQVITPDDFVAYEGKIEPNQVLVENVLKGSQTLIRTLMRQSPDELPDEIFTPEALPSFDPAQFGVDA